MIFVDEGLRPSSTQTDIDVMWSINKFRDTRIPKWRGIRNYASCSVGEFTEERAGL